MKKITIRVVEQDSKGRRHFSNQEISLQAGSLFEVYPFKLYNKNGTFKRFDNRLFCVTDGKQVRITTKRIQVRDMIKDAGFRVKRTTISEIVALKGGRLQKASHLLWAVAIPRKKVTV